MLLSALCRRGVRAFALPLVALAFAGSCIRAQANPGAPPTDAKPPAPPAISAQHREQAESLYLGGAKDLERGRFSKAEESFAHALVLDPSRPEYLQALALAQEHRITGLLQKAAQLRAMHPDQADRLLAQARGVDAQNPRVTQHDSDVAQAAARPLARIIVRRPLLAGAIALKPALDLHSFHLTNDRGAMAQTIAQAYGLRAVADPDLQGKPIRLELNDVDYATAMRVFGMLSDTFATALDEHSILIAQDTAANRTRLEHLLEEVLPLPGFSAEQITDVANMVRSIFDLRQVSVEAQIGAIAIRAPEDTLTVVNGVLDDLLDTGSEVMVDIKLYTVDTEKARNVGVQVPQSLGAFNARSEAANIVSQNSSVIQQLIASGVLPANASTTEIAAYLVFVAGLNSTSALKNTFLLFGGGLTQTGLTASTFPILNLALRESDARSLEDLQLRVADRQTAIFKSGTRYPIPTSLFSNIASSTSSSLAGVTVNGVSLSSLLSQYLGTNSLSNSAIIPQIQYEDLGITVRAVPHVQRSGGVALHLEIKISALSGAALNGIPVLASRQFSSDLTMQDGETALMASNVTESEIAAVSGIPGLSELPGFQSTTNKNTDKLHSNLVLLITPHIVRHSHDQSKGPYLPLNPRSDTE